MTVRVVGETVHLEGNWTISEAGENIASLVRALDRMEAAGKKELPIDCGRIVATDYSGLNLLLMLFECAKLRGFEPRVLDLAQQIRRDVYGLGFMQCFANVYSGSELRCDVST